MTVVPTPSPARRPSLRWLAVFAFAPPLALLIALRAPLATTVLGLIGFGVLHNVLELRYVTGRFAGVLRGRFLWVLAFLITGIVVCRLAGAQVPEILIAYAVLAAGVVYAIRRPFWRIAGLVGLCAAAAVSLRWPAFHFVVLAHLHNVVPMFFLWEWARRLPSGRTAFRLAQAGWVLLIPGLILAGVFDHVIASGASVVDAFAGGQHAVAAPVTPPDVTIGLRFLVVFAYMQTMHYVVWVGFLPRFAPDAAASFERRLPWLRGWRPWALGLGLAAALGVVFAIGYAQGHLLYASFASYHAYLEFPVLLAILFAGPAGPPDPATPSPAGRPAEPVPATAAT